MDWTPWFDLGPSNHGPTDDLLKHGLWSKVRRSRAKNQVLEEEPQSTRMDCESIDGPPVMVLWLVTWRLV